MVQVPSAGEGYQVSPLGPLTNIVKSPNVKLNSPLEPMVHLNVPHPPLKTVVNLDVVYPPLKPVVHDNAQSPMGSLPSTRVRHSKPPCPWTYHCPGLMCNGFSTDNPVTLAQHQRTHSSVRVPCILEFTDSPTITNPHQNVVFTATGGRRVVTHQPHIKQKLPTVTPHIFRFVSHSDYFSYSIIVNNS